MNATMRHHKITEFIDILVCIYPLKKLEIIANELQQGQNVIN